MKITLCGSSSFRKEKSLLRQELEILWHQAILDVWTEKLALWLAPELEKLVEHEHFEAKKQYDFIRMYYRYIQESDAILICNYEKNGIPWYIWANSFLEMWYAHALGKKIFLLYDFPEQEYIFDEIHAMECVVLEENLGKIQ